MPAAFTPKSTSFRSRFDRLGDPQALSACLSRQGHFRVAKQRGTPSYPRRAVEVTYSWQRILRYLELSSGKRPGFVAMYHT